jgi:hypothetical protein
MLKRFDIPVEKMVVEIAGPSNYCFPEAVSSLCLVIAGLLKRNNGPATQALATLHDFF